MKPQEVYNDLQIPSNSHLIDVRELQEYSAGHAQDAVHMPLSDLVNLIPKCTYDKDADVYLMCRSGGRSSVAVGLFTKAGFTKVHNVDGGIIAWDAAKLPIE